MISAVVFILGLSLCLVESWAILLARLPAFDLLDYSHGEMQ
jgi:hypothetical protein